ncbi:MAG: hypothetical protein ACLVL7_03770 [Anaerotruncus massiliensis (ex Togo et al. 2019)]
MMRWNSTKTYTEEDMIRMQQEAINRVHEFQARSQAATQQFIDVPPSAMQPVTEEPEPILFDPTPEISFSQGQAMGGPAQVTEGGVIEAESHVAPSSPPANAAVDRPDQRLIDKLGIDTETLLILGLLFLLYNERRITPCSWRSPTCSSRLSVLQSQSPYIAASLLQRGLINSPSYSPCAGRPPSRPPTGGPLRGQPERQLHSLRKSGLWLGGAPSTMRTNSRAADSGVVGARRPGWCAALLVHLHVPAPARSAGRRTPRACRRASKRAWGRP